MLLRSPSTLAGRLLHSPRHFPHTSPPLLLSLTSHTTAAGPRPTPPIHWHPVAERSHPVTSLWSLGSSPPVPGGQSSRRAGQKPDHQVPLPALLLTLHWFRGILASHASVPSPAVRITRERTSQKLSPVLRPLSSLCHILSSSLTSQLPHFWSR